MNDAITEVSSNAGLRSAVLMSSEAGMFCAGADLKERLSYTDEETEDTVRNLRATFHRIYVEEPLNRKSPCLRLLVLMEQLLVGVLRLLWLVI